MLRAAAILCLLACACGALPEDPQDAGELTDAGVADAGGQADAGVPSDAGSVDAGPTDSGVRDAGAPDAGAVDSGVADAGSPQDAGTVDAGSNEPALYSATARHSPITPSVVGNLKRIASIAPRLGNVFAKIGDSNTVNTNFFTCFSGVNVDLAGRTTLQPTIDHFKPGPSFTRVSQAATVGWSAGASIAGTPSPLENEVSALSPRYALVMFGTNDIGNGTGDAFTFARNMFSITDQLIAKGVIPLLTTLPPRDDVAIADARVPEFDAVVRGIAQARQVPLMDLDRAMRLLPSHGIGADGLHLNVFLNAGSARGCFFTPAALAFGHNTRNLLALEALARARDAVDSSIAADATAPTQQGAGTLAAPFLLPSLPFVDLRDTSKMGANRISTYSGCASVTDESGPEQLYKLTVTVPTPVKIQAFALNGADIDVHLMSDPTSGAGCVLRNDRQIVTTLQPGTWWLSLDTYVAAGAAKSGEYLLSVVPQ